jgi:hypothetical protein
MPLSPTEAAYHVIQSASYIPDSDDQHLMASDPYSLPSWLDSSLPLLIISYGLSHQMSP